MALTPEQRQILLSSKEQGLSKEQALARMYTAKPVITRPRGTLADIPSDLYQTGSELIKGLGTRYSDVKSVTEPSNIINRYRQYGGGASAAGKTLAEMGFVAGGNLVGAGFDVASAPFMAGGRAIMNPREEETVQSLFQQGLESTGLPQKYNEATPETQRNVRAGLGLLDILGLKGASRVTKGFRVGEEAATVGSKAPISTQPPRIVPQGEVPTAAVKMDVDQVINETETGLQRFANDETLTPRQREEAANSALSFKEKYIGLNPSEKARLADMGPDKLKEYLDAVHLRNIDDTKPTPYEVGSDNVNLVQEKLNGLLNDTGSDIGSTRQKLATVQANIDQVRAIDNAFASQLAKLKLEINKGQVQPIKGTINAVTDGDIKVLNDLLADLRTFKQSPTLANMIDLRMNFDGKVNYNKALRDVSNNIDPVSRSMRKSIAQEAAKMVGKTNAADLQKYSDFLDAYGDLLSYTKRQAGGEYLLRLVLSGRGGESRKLIQTIKEYTGVDLMNDATAMKLATELLGNESTRNLFRQEITKAGYDVASLISSGPIGWIGTLGQKLLDRGIDVEDVLMNAAKGGVIGTGVYVAMQENPDFAPAIGFAVASINPTIRKEIVEQVAKVADTPTLGEMQDFSRVIKEKGVSTVDGKLVFKEIEGLSKKQVENAYLDGLRVLEMDESMLDMASTKPSDIAKFFDEVIAKTEDTNSPKDKGAIPQTTDLSGQAAKLKAAGKTFEEFVKDSKPIYHGTPEKFDIFDTNVTGDGAIWFTENVDEIRANKTGGVSKTGQKLNEMERVIKPDVKLATPQIEEKMNGSDDLIANGYRGVIYPAGEYGDFTHTKLFFPNEDTITRSQLQSIWDKAQ